MKSTRLSIFSGRHILLASLFSSLLVFTACGDDDEPMDPVEEPTTLADLLAETPSLSTLNSILLSSDYDFSAVLSIATDAEGGPVTVFAPTNAAFEAYLGETELSSIPAATVEALVSNHILEGSFVAADADLTGTQTTLEGSTMYINEGTEIIVNGIAEVEQGDIMADNGVVHIVDAVIPVPVDIVATAQSFPDEFGSLEAALAQVTDDPEQADLIGVLTGTTEYTVFAPTDAAFATFLDGAALGDVDNALLESVLLYHVVPGTIFSSDLQPGTVTTEEGSTFTVNIDGTVTIDDQAGNSVTVVMTDVLCSNGVIHVIDQVIDPRAQLQPQ